MKFLRDILHNVPEYKTLKKYVDEKILPIGVVGISHIHKSHIIYSLITDKRKKAFIISPDESQAQKMANDFMSMGLRVVVYLSKDFNFRDLESRSMEYEQQRLSALSEILDDNCDVIISCIDAALQYTIPPELLRKVNKRFYISQEIPISEISEYLILCGYTKCEQVDGPGQFSVRGGILDLYTPNHLQPIRMEFWGDEIDTISYFDSETQRRTESIEEIEISTSTEVLVENPKRLAKEISEFMNQLDERKLKVCREYLLAEIEKLNNNIIPNSIDKFIPLLYKKTSTLFDYISDKYMVFMSEPQKIEQRLKANLWQWGEDIKEYLKEGVLCSGLDKYFEDEFYLDDCLSSKELIYLDIFAHSDYILPVKNIINFKARQFGIWNGSMKVLYDDLDMMYNKDTGIVILAGTERAAQSVFEDLNNKGYRVEFHNQIFELEKGKIIVLPGSLSEGFEYIDCPFKVITHGHVFEKNKKRRKKDKNAKEIYSLSELSTGDYVVHSLHGIGIFDGVQKINMQGVVKDYIKVQYAKGDTLYVPVTQLDMVSKYIGSKEDATVKLNKLGSSEWQKTKSRVRSAVKNIAKDLIKLYSERMKAKGHRFPEDNEWQRDFESHFEYEETVDQLNCIEEIKSDMQREAPMDRLLCGDVGFGKTEVALRAAFKCVSDSKQCVLLVPTTILAWQHYQNILKRFEGYPVNIQLLSRFRTPKQQEEILKQLKRGEIDFIIGTHRLVQKDVEFYDLGLVIIDEEQRFGVAQKERFKNICKNVDILTLSATPIPRTLNMAMSGIRDMSSLEEAPQNRHPVQTYVLEHDQFIINEAIRKELRRGGQVYYLHNRVEDIESVAALLKSQIPEANVDVAHGKMNESQLSEVWKKMLEQEIDILVCTTIIETGVDLPNANTLIIENADYMGLSQLHQLRGRVGRSERRAYAYFTFKRSKVLSDISQKRLSAIREFTEFGSGFKIAMRDLELRGAGNILGSEQHGNMEDVGYDMYLKLLGEAVREEKGEQIENYELECLVDLQIQAHISEKYISGLNQRLEFYRKISYIRTNEDAMDVLDELIDRFGEPPTSVKGLIDIALIRNTAASLGIYEIKQVTDALNLYQRKINMKQVSEILATAKRKVLFNAGSTPYISVKLNKGDNPVEVLREVLDLSQPITSG